MTENKTGLGAFARGSLKTAAMALLRCFLPMNPLGQSVSETSSTGMTNGDCEDELMDLTWRLQALARREE